MHFIIIRALKKQEMYNKTMMILKDNISGLDGLVKTEFSIKREGNVLFCHFNAYDSSLNSYSDKNNDRQFDGDVVEIFIDIGEKDSYLEIEVAPNGAIFVANIKNLKVNFIDNSFVKSKVSIKGNDYFVDLVIDLSSFNIIKPIRYNAFRIETKNIKTNYILLAVSPTLCDTFHVRDKFIALE